MFLSTKANWAYACLHDVCRSDDIWAANKIEIEFKSLLLLETKDGYRMPALVHSDLEVVDSEGKRIAASYIAYQGLQRQRDSLVNQVQSNLVTGCTAVINEELALCIAHSGSGNHA